MLPAVEQIVVGRRLYCLAVLLSPTLAEPVVRRLQAPQPSLRRRASARVGESIGSITGPNEHCAELASQCGKRLPGPRVVPCPDHLPDPVQLFDEELVGREEISEEANGCVLGRFHRYWPWMSARS